MGHGYILLKTEDSPNKRIPENTAMILIGSNMLHVINIESKLMGQITYTTLVIEFFVTILNHETHKIATTSIIIIKI